MTPSLMSVGPGFWQMLVDLIRVRLCHTVPRKRKLTTNPTGINLEIAKLTKI